MTPRIPLVNISERFRERNLYLSKNRKTKAIKVVSRQVKTRREIIANSRKEALWKVRITLMASATSSTKDRESDRSCNLTKTALSLRNVHRARVQWRETENSVECCSILRAFLPKRVKAQENLVLRNLLLSTQGKSSIHLALKRECFPRSDVTLCFLTN